MRSRLSLLFISLLLAALGLSACAPATPAPAAGGSASVGSLQITGAWARAASLMGAQPTEMAMGSSGGGMEMAGTNSAAYLVIKNTGGQADKLIKAESDVAKAVEIHNVKMENDVMKMFQVDGVDVPANGQAELKPGSFHVMLIGLTRDLKAGEKIQLTLTFATAGTVTVEAEVREP